MIEDGASDQEIACRHFGAWTRIRTAIQEYRRLIAPRRFEVRFQLDSFPEAWIADFEFLPSEKGAEIIWGPSGCGKTSFIKARFPNYLFVTHLDVLREYDSSRFDGLIFDDMDFRHLPRTTQIHLLDFHDDRHIHCRYSAAFIPAGTRKIFSTNEVGGHIFDLADAAIRRRVSITRFDHEETNF